MTHEKQRAILNFWFGEDPLKPLANLPVWFAKNSRMDALIREQFGSMIEDAGNGAFEDWSKTADGALALVILCDQFPRNVFREEPEAFAFDHIALRAAQIAMASGLDRKMSVVERCFLYLPFEHSEDADLQKRSVELFRDLFESAQGDEQLFIAQALDYAVRHCEIIEKFGRFPHRNEILGRSSTREEREFLKRPGSVF
jgi:uncharacterized protein (DUF924 family)